MILTTHISIEKKSEAQRLSELYQAWRDSGGVPTIITQETLRQMGMKKARWSGPIGDGNAGAYVPGVKLPPSRTWSDEEHAKRKSDRIKESLRLRKLKGLPVGGNGTREKSA